MQRRESTKKGNVLEIEVELEHGVFETRYIPLEVKFTMATDVAFSVLTDLGKSAFAIYMVILKHRNMKTNKCFPSYATIKEESGCGLSTIKVALNELETSSYLSINSGMRGIANNYYFPKEWFYKYFEDDINQRMAKRKDKPVQEKRMDKKDKEIQKLKEDLMKANKEIGRLKDRQSGATYTHMVEDEVDPF